MSSAEQDQPAEASGAAAAATTAECKPETTTTTTEAESSTSKASLPPLSPAEFRAYNRLSEQMNYFHDHFRQTWNLLWEAATSGRRPSGMSLKQFIDEGLHFLSFLETHHNIEESYLFPILARKMPEFQAGTPSKGGASKPRNNKGAAELLQQHREIHAGMDVLEEYLRACRNRETELEMGVLKEKMESWGGVLWKHLDQEVKTLGAENMRKYWTIEEVKRLPI